MWPSVDAHSQQQPQLQDERTNQPASLSWLISYRKDYVHDRRRCVMPVLHSGVTMKHSDDQPSRFSFKSHEFGQWGTCFCMWNTRTDAPHSHFLERHVGIKIVLHCDLSSVIPKPPCSRGSRPTPSTLFEHYTNQTRSMTMIKTLTQNTSPTKRLPNYAAGNSKDSLARIFRFRTRLKNALTCPVLLLPRSSLLKAPTQDDERRGSWAALRTFAAQPRMFIRTPPSEEGWGREEKCARKENKRG